jgi:hypothetical protein
MSRPMPVQSRRYHVHTQLLGLGAAHVCSVVRVSRRFGLSRHTFYQYGHHAEQGPLASVAGTPPVHGSATPPPLVEAVWRAQGPHPRVGKPRRATRLDPHGGRLAPTTGPRRVRQAAPSVPPVPGPRHRWNACAARAPHVIWARARGSRDPRTHAGLARALLSSRAEHARPGIARGWSERQPVSAVVAGRQAAVLPSGVPPPRVCAHGRPCTGRPCRRVGAARPLTVESAPPHDPPDQGQSARFCRPARRARPRAQAPDRATGVPTVGSEAENHDRLPRRVTAAAGPAQAPGLRVRWQPSAARPVPLALSVDDGVPVQPPRPGPWTRPGKAARGRSERKPAAHVPARHTGEVIDVNAGTDHLDVASLGPLVQRRRQP